MLEIIFLVNTPSTLFMLRIAVFLASEILMEIKEILLIAKIIDLGNLDAIN